MHDLRSGFGGGLGKENQLLFAVPSFKDTGHAGSITGAASLSSPGVSGALTRRLAYISRSRAVAFTLSSGVSSAGVNPESKASGSILFSAGTFPIAVIGDSSSLVVTVAFESGVVVGTDDSVVEDWSNVVEVEEVSSKLSTDDDKVTVNSEESNSFEDVDVEGVLASSAVLVKVVDCID